MNQPASPGSSQPGQHGTRKAPVMSRAAAGAYLTVKGAGKCAGTIGFDLDDPGVSRFIARTADGQAAGLITDTGRSFRVETPGATDWCAHWQAAAEAVFGPDVTVELA
jgi:hypothetical protein